MVLWNQPPIAKVYEALSAVAGGRVKLIGETSAQVVSSRGDKMYIVRWSSDGREITSNDNASRWQGYVGYPIIAVLLLIGRLCYDPTIARYLVGVPWYDLNAQYKHNYDAAVDHVLEGLRLRGIDEGTVKAEAAHIHGALARLKLERPTTKSSRNEK